MQSALAEEETKGGAHRWTGEAEHDGQGRDGVLGGALRPDRASARQRRVKAAHPLARVAATLET